MRVAHLSSWNQRCGVADYSEHLVQALQEVAPDHQAERVALPTQPGARAVGSLAAQLNGCDLIHVQYAYTFFGGFHPSRFWWPRLASRLRRPLFLTLHELDLSHDRTARGRLAGWLKRWVLGRVVDSRGLQRILVHNQEFEVCLRAMTGVEVRYRPMPVETVPATPPSPSPVLESLGISGLRPLVILGFLARRKGYDLALRALTQLPPEYVLVAAGGQHDSDRTDTTGWIREIARNLGVEGRLVITGYLSDVAMEQITAGAAAILAPFHSMSGSASLAYALARGKPVIASDLPENQRLGAVRLFRSGDPEDLAKAVREVTGDPVLNQRLAAAARNYARDHGYPVLAAELAEWYRSLNPIHE